MDVMTPKEFYDALVECVADQVAKDLEIDDRVGNYAEEDAHEDMDDVLCKLLRQLGYDKGIKFYESCKKWYD